MSPRAGHSRDESQLEWLTFHVSQVENQFCKPICEPAAVGQAETGEIQKAGEGFMPQIGRGQTR